MKRHLASLVLALLLVLSLLAGCQPNAQTAAATTAVATTAKSAASDSVQLTDVGTYPIVREPVTLRVFYRVNPNVIDVATNHSVIWLQEKTNVVVEWNAVSSAEASEKVNLLLTTNNKNDMPDVFMTNLSRPAAESYGIQGIFIPLGDLIDKNAPNLLELFAHNETVRPKLTAYDGNIYFLSKYWEGVHDKHPEKMWINMEWLDNLGLDVPKTTEDFYNVLTAFKEEDANGNGDAGDEIPFIAHTGWMSAIPYYIMSSFVYYSPTAYVEDGVVKVSYAQEGWRDGLMYYKRLYDEQLLDNECFSMTAEQAKALASATTGNRVGCNVSGAIEIFDFSDPELLKYKTIPPLEGPTGLRQSSKYNWEASPFFMITSYCAIPEVAIRWADCQIKNIVPDLLNDDYDWYNLWYGSEGISWEKAGPNDVGLSGGPAKYRWLFNWGEQSNDHLYEGFLFNENVGLKALMAAKTDGTYDQEKVLYQETINNYNPYAADKTIPGMSLKPEENEEIAQLSTDLNTYYKEMMAKFIRGEANLSTDWDAYIKELDVIGLQEYLDIYQKAYDRYLEFSK